ncbi:MAG: hypothetical protein AAAC47_16660, partial [Pararhizobium sp.]
IRFQRLTTDELAGVVETGRRGRVFTRPFSLGGCRKSETDVYGACDFRVHQRFGAKPWSAMHAQNTPSEATAPAIHALPAAIAVSTERPDRFACSNRPSYDAGEIDRQSPDDELLQAAKAVPMHITQNPCISPSALQINENARGTAGGQDR